MRPTDEKEIEQKIKEMKDNNAFGPNSIRTKILKVHSKTLSKPLAEPKFCKFLSFLKQQISFSSNFASLFQYHET